MHSVALIGCSGSHISTRVNAVDVVRKLLAWSMPSVSTIDTGVFAAIMEAKQEWEDAADVLPEIVGLVNRSRRIVRINRAIERWSLGEVRNAIGRDVHDVLHPQCCAHRCDLELLLDCAFGKLDVSPTASFELADRASQKDLVVALNVTERPADGSVENNWSSAALVVSNVTTMRRAERDLKLFNRVLEQRVADRTERLTGINRALRAEVVRRRSAEELLRDSKVELEALSERLVTAQEEERKRIAQDLHDSVSQGMGAIKYSLERANLLIQRGSSEQANEVIAHAVTRTQQVMDEVRAISMNLRPAALDDLGAVSAIRSFYRSWRAVYTSVSIKEDIAVADRDIPHGIATHVYRAVQESLNNVARHSQAQRVWLTIRILDGNLVVTIRDDGVGFNPDTDSTPGGRTSLGLLGLRERTERSGGSCQVTTTPGNGTTVCLQWPLAVGVAARHANATLN
jgi:signal transduction histidine kinase